MFTTPARATPRRSVRPRDSVSHASLFSGTSAAPTPIVRSRQSTVVRPASPAVSERREARDDDRDRQIWSKDDRHTVHFTSGLPPDVARLVSQHDLYSVTAQVDPSSGFALVSAPVHAIAWNYAKRTQNPTVYIFPSPQPERSPLPTVPPALSAFVGAGEPGLLLVSATGEMRFWENMGVALSNVQRFQSVQLTLGDDFAERLWKVDYSTFVLTTTGSMAWCIRIVPSGGRLVPVATQFTRNGGMFNRSSPAIFPESFDAGGIVGAAPTPGGVYLLGRQTLQKWLIGPDGSVRLVQEYNLCESVAAGVFDEDEWRQGNAHLELPDTLAALVSYTKLHGSSDQNRPQNKYAVVLFENSINTVTLSNIVYLSFTAYDDPGMDVPRLYIPPGSQTAFVRFSDVVVMASLTSTPYEDTITLRTGLGGPRNAFLGCGRGTVPGHAASSLVALAATGGVMTIVVNEGVMRTKNLSPQASATARLKSKLEQAVFFGDRNNNPLTFDLPSGWQGDLAAAAEAVSAEVVSSSSPYMTPIFEVRPQLMDRLARMKEVMMFVHHNNALDKIPESARRRLCNQAEKVAAAVDLWDYQNRVMDKLNTDSPQSLLADSIQALSHGQDGDDVVRLFFRKHVGELSQLLATVFATFQAAVQSAGQGDISSWVLEANRIFLIALRSSAAYRESFADMYHVDPSHPMSELWTASDDMIHELDSLYGVTQQLIKDRTRRLGSIVDESSARNASTELGQQQREQEQLKEQMAQLAAALCDNMEDRLRASAVRDKTDAADGLGLKERWEEMRPRIIRPLVEIDHTREAYQLAEDHRDFETLVYLCHHPSAASGAARIETYIERFREQFAFVLYQWYIDNGELHKLLSQDEVYGQLLSAFFATHPHPELAWMQDIACKRYGAAATALVAVDGATAQLAQKQLVASIAKLAAVAEVKMQSTPESRTILSDVDESLDVIAVQESLRASLVKASTPAVGPRTPSAAVFVQNHGNGVVDKPALKRLLETRVERLLAGDALDTEDLVDVLTLHDPLEGREEDAAVALRRTANDDSLPEGRKMVAITSVWRRTYICDAWDVIAHTAGRSEEGQRRLLRSTRTYATLKALRGTDLPPVFTRAPSAATTAPSDAELAARFPSFSPSDIAALAADHAAEVDALETLISDGLEERVRAVRELVEADLAEDVEM